MKISPVYTVKRKSKTKRDRFGEIIITAKIGDTISNCRGSGCAYFNPVINRPSWFTAVYPTITKVIRPPCTKMLHNFSFTCKCIVRVIWIAGQIGVHNNIIKSGVCRCPGSCKSNCACFIRT